MIKLAIFLTAAAARLAAQQSCSYALDPPSYQIGPDATTVLKFNVIAPDGCPWAPIIPASSSWVHLNAIGGSSGNGFVAWYADRNPLPVSRTGTINIAAGVGLTITQAAGTCSYAVTPTSVSVPAAGGTGSLALTTQCVWAVGVNGSWITVPKPDAGVGSATVTYTVAANQCMGGRSGSIALGYPGKNLPPELQVTTTISQAGSPTGLVVSPTSFTLPATAGQGSVTVTVPTGCPWSAVSNVSWLQLQRPIAGSGPGEVAFAISANSGPERTGIITLPPLTITVTQAAGAAPPAPTPQITAVTNGASYATGAISPGGIVSVFGTNLGPATPVTLQLTPSGDAILNTLAGVQLLFDGTAAPLIFVSAGQINAIVPYSLSGKTSTQVQVQAGGVTSASFTKPVQASTPGIFSQDRSGLGPGAILNQSYQVNGSASRAAAGEIVMIYCTGAGVTNPASSDGAITVAPFPALTLPVSVTIGGVDAPVGYQGAAPGSVAGLTQINALVPDGVSGVVPIVVKIGSAQSQPGVTVAIK